MKLLQRLALIVVIATAITAVRATPVASAQQKRTEMNTEDDKDDKLVDKRDDDDDDDDVRHQIQLIDVDVVKRRRGIG